MPLKLIAAAKDSWACFFFKWEFFQRFAQQYYSTLMYSSDEEDETDKEDINEWTRGLAWSVTIDFVIRFIIFKL